MTDFKAYTEFCKTTESLPESVDVNIADLKLALNVVAKGNQLLDMIKKNAFYGKKFNRTQWQKITASLNIDIAAGSEASRKALSHPVPTEALAFDVRTAHAIIGMNTEAGELIENMSATLFEGQEFDAVNFGEEVGDLMWYTAVGLDATSQDFDQCLATNKAKLEARYSEGKFTSEAAIERDLTTEREILTDGVNIPKIEEVAKKADIELEVKPEVVDEVDENITPEPNDPADEKGPAPEKAPAKAKKAGTKKSK